jgi:hypothetical protein
MRQLRARDIAKQFGFTTRAAAGEIPGTRLWTEGVLTV